MKRSATNSSRSRRVLARVLADDMRTVNGGFGGGGVIWCNDVREGSGVANSNDTGSNPNADTD